MNKFIAIFLILIPFITNGQGNRKSNFIYGKCSQIYFGSYNPDTPNSLSDLPDTIRIKLVSHLVDRLGQSFYSKVKLSGGQIVDLERLYLVNENAKNYQWTPYSYYLCFSFEDKEKGVGLYTSQIVLDKNGNVIKDIELPSIRINPKKANIISLYEAADIAKRYDFTNTFDNASLWYNRDTDNLNWCFKKIVNDNGLTFGTETLIINAHTGEKMEISYGGGIR